MWTITTNQVWLLCCVTMLALQQLSDSSKLWGNNNNLVTLSSVLSQGSSVRSWQVSGQRQSGAGSIVIMNGRKLSVSSLRWSALDTECALNVMYNYLCIFAVLTEPEVGLKVRYALSDLPESLHVSYLFSPEPKWCCWCYSKCPQPPCLPGHVQEAECSQVIMSWNV